MLLKIHNSKGRKHCNYGRIIEQNDGKHDKYMPHPYKDRRDRRKAKKQAFLLYKEGGGDEEKSMTRKRSIETCPIDNSSLISHFAKWMEIVRFNTENEWSKGFPFEFV